MTSLSQSAFYERAAKDGARSGTGQNALEFLKKECDKLSKQCMSQQRSIKSYESAIETLTRNYKEKAQEQKLKNTIFE